MFKVITLLAKTRCWSPTCIEFSWERLATFLNRKLVNFMFTR